jgi:hypothetical protein
MTAPVQQTEFVARFEAAWKVGTTEALATILHPDLCLVTPLAPALRGRTAALHLLGNFLALMPAPRIRIHRWTAAGDGFVLIEFSFYGTVGRRAVQLDLVDSFELVDGLAVRRTAYFNPAPLVRAVLTQPWLLWRLLKRSVAFRRGALA